MEEKIIINEAEAINPEDLMKEKLKDELALLSSPTDLGWNDLYNKYKKEKGPEFSVIRVGGLHKKNVPESRDFIQNGFVKYTAETGTGNAHKFLFFGKKKVDTIESGKLEIVKDKADASIFTPEDAKIFIDAIKRNKDFSLKEASFFQEAIDSSVANASSALSIILKTFFKQLCDVSGSDEGPINFINGGLNVIIQVCNKRNSPLVGNPLLDVLANAFNNDAVRNNFRVSNLTITTLTNILAKSIISVADLKKLGKFKAVIIFNNSLYKLSADRVNDLFNLFNQAESLSKSQIGIEALKGIESLDLAKHLLMAQGTEPADVFQKVVLGGTLGEDEKIETLGHTVEDNDGNLLKWYIRTPDEAKSLLDKIAEGREEGKDTKNYYLQIINESTVNIKKCEITNETDEQIMIKLGSVSLKKNDIIRLVRTEDSTKDNTAITNILVSNLDLFKSDDMSDKFEVKDRKIILKKDLNTGLEFKIGGESLRILTSVKLISPVEDHEKEPEEEKEEEIPVEETPKEETPVEETIDKTGLVEVEPTGTLDGEVLRDVSVEVGDVVTGLDGKEIKVTAETVGDGKWDIKAGTKVYQKPVDLNHLSNGKSIGDIIISRDVFRAEYPTLTSREKARIRSIVNPAWLPAA